MYYPHPCYIKYFEYSQKQGTGTIHSFTQTVFLSISEKVYLQYLYCRGNFEFLIVLFYDEPDFSIITTQFGGPEPRLLRHAQQQYIRKNENYLW